MIVAGALFYQHLDLSPAMRGLGSLSACFLHAHGVCAHSEILRWENFDGGIEGDSQNENALFIVPRVFGILHGGPIQYN